MTNNETIVLDARLVDVISKSVFRAELANGHRLIAYPAQKALKLSTPWRVGDTVRLAISPYDFSKGRLPDAVENE